jgi:hypothetical protein
MKSLCTYLICPVLRDNYLEMFLFTAILLHFYKCYVGLAPVSNGYSFLFLEALDSDNDNREVSVNKKYTHKKFSSVAVDRWLEGTIKV